MSNSGPDASAKSAYTINSIDFTLFELHSNVYKNLEQSGQKQSDQNTIIVQAKNIIKEYTSFLGEFIIPTQLKQTDTLQFKPTKNSIRTADLHSSGSATQLYAREAGIESMTDKEMNPGTQNHQMAVQGSDQRSLTEGYVSPKDSNLQRFKQGYTQEESFFKLIHSIIIANQPATIDQNKAQKIVDQSKIIMAVVDSLLLNKIINEKNKPDKSTQEKTFSSVNPKSIDDLVMNSISTDMVSSTNNMSSEISTLMSDISDYVNTPDMVETTLETTFTPQIEAINKSIASTSATVLTLLNKIVILSVMTIPELKTKIKENLKPSTIIIKNGFFVVGGNIQCSNLQRFKSSDFTNMHCLKDNPFAGKTSLITAPLTNENLPELNNKICNSSPKPIYIVGNLYCVNGQLIPPDLDDIIGIYNEEPSKNLENNGITTPLTDNPDINAIRKALKISGFCSSLESVAPSHVVSKEPNYLSQTAASYPKIHEPPNSVLIPEETKRLKIEADAIIAADKQIAADTKLSAATEAAKLKKQAEYAKIAADTAKAKDKAKAADKAKSISIITKPKQGFGSASKRFGKGGGNNYTRKKQLVTNNSKTRKNYYDDYESDDKSDSESNEFMHE